VVTGRSLVMSHKPFFSVILCVRNGMPYLQDAVQSILSLDYSNYEVVMQDGASADGSLEFLRQFEHRPGWSLVSMPDSGVGQGFNRAAQRCRGDIIASVDADNLIYPKAFKLVAEAYGDSPGAAVIYGSMGMIDARGAVLHEWVPRAFDLLGLMDGTVVPPLATSFFSRSGCGDEFRFDETMATVPDFDLWLRLSSKPIVRMASNELLAAIRVGDMSSTSNEAMYEKIIALKVEALRRFLDGPSRDRAVEALFDRCRAGLYLWAVDSMGVIGAGQGNTDRYFRDALDTDIGSERFREIVRRTKPSLRLPTPELVAEIYSEGIARLRELKFEDAIVYFELLQRSGCESTRMGELIDDAIVHTKDFEIARLHELLTDEVGRRDALLRDQEASLERQQQDRLGLEDEVNRRDQLLRDQEASLQAEIQRRDQIIAELHKTPAKRFGWF